MIKKESIEKLYVILKKNIKLKNKINPKLKDEVIIKKYTSHS